MKIQYNAPVTLSFTIICVLVLGSNSVLFDQVMPYFTVYPHMDIGNPVDYFRLFSHVMGHGGWDHLVGNFTFILLLGPILEEKYGSQQLLFMMFITALITGILNVLIFSTGLLGASGIVFMFILLSSVVNAQKGKIPLTFILVALLFLGKEVMGILENDQISQFAHIVGGICGAAFGFMSGGKDKTAVESSSETQQLY